MPVTTTWTDPSTSAIDLVTGQTLDQTHWENVCSDLYFLGGSSGRVTQATSGDNTSSTVTTTSTGYVDLDNVNTNLTLTTSGGDILVFCSGSFFSSAANDTLFLAMALDGNTEQGEVIVGLPSTSSQEVGGFAYRFAAPAAGSHTFHMRWRGNLGTNTYSCPRRHMVVVELKR